MELIISSTDTENNVKIWVQINAVVVVVVVIVDKHNFS